MAKRKRPSSLLANYLFADGDHEIDAYRYISDIQLDTNKFRNSSKTDRISSLKDHRESLKNAFSLAQRQITIMSPFLTINALVADGIPRLIQETCRRNVHVITYIDNQLSKICKRESKVLKAKEMLLDAGAEVKVVHRAHNKTICVDEFLLIEGSFNWLSASRDLRSSFQRHETSLCYKGEGVDEMIRQALGEMENRLLKETTTLKA